MNRERLFNNQSHWWCKLNGKFSMYCSMKETELNNNVKQNNGSYLFWKCENIALKLEPEVAQLYWGYWENSTTRSTLSLRSKKKLISKTIFFTVLIYEKNLRFNLLQCFISQRIYITKSHVVLMRCCFWRNLVQFFAHEFSLKIQRFYCWLRQVIE